MTGRVEQRETRYRGAELKFLIDESTAAGILEWARGLMQPDPHGGGAHGDGYHTTTIYLDTPALDVYWRRRSYGRSKLRIRRYGDAAHAFVERKLRTGCVLAKRRTMVPLAELPRLQASSAGDWAGRWFADRVRMRRLSAACQVAYARTARTLATDYGLARLTLDTDLRVLPADRPLYQPGRGPLVAGVHIILEMKFAVAMPAAFKRLVEEFRLEPRPVSKYRLSMSTITSVARGVRLQQDGHAEGDCVRRPALGIEASHA